MPNRDGKWPQWRGSMTWRWMGSCTWKNEQEKNEQNIPFWSWQGKRCGKWMKRWLWNRWNSIEESKEKDNNTKE